MKKLPVIFLLFFAACGQEKSSQPNAKLSSDSLTVKNQPIATKARETGSSVIIRSDHTTESSSAGVVAKEGTIVQILDVYTAGNSNEAILKRSITVVKNEYHINLPSGKAIHILEDRRDSVRVSFSTTGYGIEEATISKDVIEAMSGQKWYKIHTTDNITGWIYGEFIEEIQS